MKKKLTAILLCFMMLAASVPTGVVYADEEELNEQIEQIEVIEEPASEIPEEIEIPEEKVVGELEGELEVTGENSEEIPEEDEGISVELEEIPEELLEETPAPVDFDVVSAYEYAMTLGEEEIEAYIAALTPEQYDALVAYAMDLSGETEAVIEEEYIPPETVVFTDAGPFMPPVEVKTRKLMMAPKGGDNLLGGANAGTSDTVDAEGLETKKTITPKQNDPNTFTVTIESYSTGKVVTEVVSTPVDIVLVLDQSGSMADDFGNTSRQAAMKNAVNRFIGEVADKYSEKADHRIAIVTFGSDSEPLMGWTFVDAVGKTNLKAKINGLPSSPSGATQVDLGMSEAEELISNPQYTGSNTMRNQVVIVFTDGVPTTSTSFSTSVANKALSSAKRMKDAGVTVYSVGIFTGANKNELHGPGVESSSGVIDPTCNGDVGSQWGRKFKTWIGALLGDVYDWDVHAGNRFLNYISNNFMSADEIGLSFTEADLPLYHRRGWRITKNFTRDSSDYYLTADDEDSLNRIFKTISQQIETHDIDLGSSAVVKDVVTDYFTAPENASAVSAKTYACTGFSNGVPQFSTTASSTIDSSNISVSNQTVTVTGFDYNANCVINDNGTPKGQKLVVEFDITAEDYFLGGNNVPTNGGDSGVYYDNSIIEEFDVPHANVPLLETLITVSADVNVYLMGGIGFDTLKTSSKITVKGRITGEDREYTSNEVDKSYAGMASDDIVIKDKNDDSLTTYQNLKDDQTYIANVSIAATETAVSGSEGTAITQPITASAEGHINVFTPTLTFQDSTGDYNDTLSAAYYEEHNLVSTVWKHGETVAVEDSMTGVEPELTLVYNPDSGKLTQEITVKVTAVKIGDTTISSDDYTFVWIPDESAACDCETAPNGAQFRIHLNTGFLKITKALADGTTIDDDQSFIFTIQGTNYAMTVVINGEGSVTISDIPSGTYTVTEDTAWSWRYVPETVTVKVGSEDSADYDSSTGAMVTSGLTTEVTFTNKRSDTGTKWLSGDCYCDNEFTGKVDEEGGISE